MDASALAMDLLRWEQKRRELDELEAAIKDSVMQIGQTQTVGNVRATYSKGRKMYNYQAAADGHPMVSQTTVDLFTTPKVDWRGICKHAGIEDVPFKQGVPSVSLRLMD